MAPTRRQFLGAATTSTVVGMAGCGDGSGESGADTGSGGDSSTNDTGSGGDTPTGTPTPRPPAVTVETAAHPNLGEILVDGDGMALYMFDSDTQGDLASTCTEGCAEAWPPLTAEGDPAAGENVTADLETFERDDGSTQIAANGWPLYYFQNDESPGDANGQGVNDVWWVLDPSGGPVRSSSATPTPAETTDDGISY